MIYTLNKSNNPFNGLNTTMRSMQKTGLTKHITGGIKSLDEIEQASLVICGNYLPNEVYAMRQSLPTSVKMAYLFCSPLGQASCNGEIGILEAVLRLLDDPYYRLDYIFFSDEDAASIFAKDRVKWLPVVSDFEGTSVSPPFKSGILLMGNNLRPSRNFLNQLAGIKAAKEHYSIKEPVNSYFMPYDVFSFYKDLLKIEDWHNYSEPITETEKANIIASNKVGLQVTYSDSFNIAAYEHAMCGTACLANGTLNWIPSPYCVWKIDSPTDIGKHIADIINNEKQYADLTDIFKKSAIDTMKYHYEICDEVLRECQ